MRAVGCGSRHVKAMQGCPSCGSLVLGEAHLLQLLQELLIDLGLHLLGGHKLQRKHPLWKW